MIRAIEAPIQPEIAAQSLSSAQATTICHYLGGLRQAGLWPTSRLLAQNINELYAAGKRYSSCKGTKNCFCAWGGAETKSEDSWRLAMDTAMNQNKGLCLECVNQGRSVVSQDNCWSDRNCNYGGQA